MRNQRFINFSEFVTKARPHLDDKSIGIVVRVLFLREGFSSVAKDINRSYASVEKSYRRAIKLLTTSQDREFANQILSRILYNKRSDKRCRIRNKDE